MSNHLLKNRKIIEIARRIALSRKGDKPINEKDYQDLIELFQKFDTDSTKPLVEAVVDSIKNSMTDYPIKNTLSQSLAYHIDSLNSKNKYIPKIREAKMPVRYFGADWDMKELTKKTAHPLHFIFLSESDNTILHAFNSYHEVEEALKQERMFDMIRYEINKLNTLTTQAIQTIYGHSISVNTFEDWQERMGQINSGYLNPPPTDSRLPDAARPNAKALFFEHINYGGEVLELDPGYYYSNLLEKWMHWFIFIMTDDWNDKISSIKAGDGTIIAFEHVFEGGATLTIHGSVPIPHYKSTTSTLGHPYTYIDYWVYNRRELPRLDLAGWNDRISSVYHYK